MDTFDSVVSKINGVGLLFGNQDLFGDVVGGIQNLASGLKWLKTVNAIGIIMDSKQLELISVVLVKHSKKVDSVQ